METAGPFRPILPYSPRRYPRAPSAKPFVQPGRVRKCDWVSEGSANVLSRSKPSVHEPEGSIAGSLYTLRQWPLSIVAVLEKHEPMC